METLIRVCINVRIMPLTYWDSHSVTVRARTQAVDYDKLISQANKRHQLHWPLKQTTLQVPALMRRTAYFPPHVSRSLRQTKVDITGLNLSAAMAGRQKHR